MGGCRPRPGGIAHAAVGLHQMQPAPIPGVAVALVIIAGDRHRRLVVGGPHVIGFNVATELFAIPVEGSGRAILVEVVVAEPEIRGKAYAVAARGLPVVLAELDELPAIARQEIGWPG